ncbi:hypothetical protein P170DRAFT_192213 [Aspergillus steynii IBT 23096]|uniref:Grh/CP2 DB domain-containing protein n=1 Tax=Aspergillus steynii IBT 23096 TaxID=1392250 RepID=A0A2I2GA45_9EURO|nr:uncharacterized protein P170DRAFT_192213 [Aspergillus steynii IBT 23096]PLB49751.1 hypothetical protein P170DRAFT_192213 [Aspergillus steynii IBT 23096]
MFGKRRTAQKPDESFIRDFQRQFGSVASRSYSPQTPVRDPADHAVPQVPEEPQDADHVPKDSVMADQSPVQFLSPITRQNCSCSLAGSRMCTVLHSPAGDLHTPAHDCNGSTNPWIWSRISNLDANLSDEPLPGHPLQSHHPLNFIDPMLSGLTNSPEPFLRRHSEYDSLGLLTQGNVFHQDIPSKPDSLHGPLPHDPEVALDHRSQDSPALRYRVTLHAPTATFNQTREIPVTYLNRCQPYLISVTDTRPPSFRVHPARYRTYVRISFDNAAQREDPTGSWRLWRDGRGLSEARKRDGKLSAVEFVNVRNDGFREEGAAHVELQGSSFDGFCVEWTVDPHAVRVGCEMHVAFNCLSTDFSLSKGVKGAPLRLCAKTELVSQGLIQQPGAPSSTEICYCKVKVFRDHGAERKLSNDTIHLRRAIRKMEEKIAEAEFYNTKAPGKKKRVRVPLSSRPSEHLLESVDAEPSSSRVPRRAHSFSTGEDLYQELFELRKVFTSSQPTSVLSLRASDQDDPDQFPVELSSGTSSPKPPARSATQSEMPSEMNTDTEWMEMLEDRGDETSGYPGSDVPRSSLQTPANDGQTLENVPIRSRGGHGKAVACFYVLCRVDGQTDEYYRALYLMERTVGNLKSQLSKVRDISPERIVRLLRVNQAGLRIVIDDTVVREIPEGQDMIVEFQPGYDVSLPAEDFEVALFF